MTRIEIQINEPAILPELAEKLEDALRDFIIEFLGADVQGVIYDELTGNSTVIRKEVNEI